MAVRQYPRFLDNEQIASALVRSLARSPSITDLHLARLRSPPTDRSLDPVDNASRSPRRRNGSDRRAAGVLPIGEPQESLLPRRSRRVYKSISRR